MKVPGFLSPPRGNLPSPRSPLPQEKEATQSFGKHVALAELPFSLVWSPRSAKRAKPPLQGEPAAPRGRPGAADAARRGPSHVRTGGRRFQGSFSRGPPHVARAASSAVPRSSIRAQRPLGAKENSTRRDTHGPRVVLPFPSGLRGCPGSSCQCPLSTFARSRDGLHEAFSPPRQRPFRFCAAVLCSLVQFH